MQIGQYELSHNMEKLINRVVAKSGLTEAEVIARAFSLLSIADEAISAGNAMSVINHRNEVVTRIKVW